MFKSSILYRRLWYVRKRNIKNVHILLRFTAALLILLFSISFITDRFLPDLKKSIESGIHAAVDPIIAENKGD